MAAEKKKKKSIVADQLKIAVDQILHNANNVKKKKICRNNRNSFWIEKFRSCKR